MTITELATLKLTQPFTSPFLLSFFTRLAKLQGAYSSHSLLYFRDITADSDTQGEGETIYLISGWDSVKKHEEWIATETNQNLLKELSEAGTVSIEGLVHIGVDFKDLEEKMGSVFGIEIQVVSGSGEVQGGGHMGGLLWESNGKDVEGKSENSVFGLRAYDEQSWGALLSNDQTERKDVRRAIRVQIQA